MFKCYLPKVEFGNGAIGILGCRAMEMGSKAILIIDPYLDSKGLGNSIALNLKKSGISSIKYSDIKPNPSCFKVDKVSNIVREKKCNTVIAIGGGSVIDFGKGVAVVSGNPGTC
jgi:alcohol dehydrogenase class IV